jgi:hypothetical protein
VFYEFFCGLKGPKFEPFAAVARKRSSRNLSSVSEKYEAEEPAQLEAAVAAISELEKRMNGHAPSSPGVRDCSCSFLNAA